nr:SpaH/EbpB family LPXTG-anchored major pilin [Leucobacter edaphi]
MKKSESWDILKRLQFTNATTATDPGAVSPQPSTYTLVDQAVQVTAANGIATFGNLPVGAYLVEETKAPANVTAHTAPFFVSVPLPFENKWLNDVHVYPKNSVTGVEKEAGNPDGLGLGAHVPWTVTVKIPTLAPGDTFTRFSITDALDSRLAYAPAASDALSVVGGAAVPADAYTLSAAGSNPVVLSFTDPQGLAWLAANQGKSVSWTLTTQVVSNDGDGSIENNALVNINGDDFETTTPGTTNWGAVQILKHAEGNAAATLSGAVFEVYEAETGGTPIPVRVDAAKPAQTQFTTDNTGRVVIPGLSVGENGSKVYYLKEVVAPGGYALLTDRIAVTVTTGGVATPVEISIANRTDEGTIFPNLPLTGGSGAILLTVIGAGLLAIAVGAVVVRRRKMAAEV